MAETPTASVESVTDEQIQQQMQQSGQQNPVSQSSGPGITWMSLLAALSADDSTKPSSADVKVSCTLKRDGSNFRKWMNELVVAAINKECTEAIQKSTPNTRANAAALQFINTSIPEDWEPEGTAKHVAFDALTWICNRFQGGHDRSINKGWLNQLQNDKMTREETFEQYVTKKYSLYENLKGNSHSLEHEDLTNSVIDCLPLEFESSKTALYTQVIGMSQTQMVKHLRIQAYALRFDDLSPRPIPRAAPAILKTPANPPLLHEKTARHPSGAGSVENEATPSESARSGQRKELLIVLVDLQLEYLHLERQLHVRPQNPVQLSMLQMVLYLIMYICRPYMQ
jgi:hypothetical protein